MKIKDLPPNTNLGGIKVKTPDGIIGYWTSQYTKGVWLSENYQRHGRIFPVFIKDLIETLEWDITEEEVNVNDRTVYGTYDNPTEHLKVALEAISRIAGINLPMIDCPFCEEGKGYLKTKQTELSYRGETFIVPANFYECNNCHQSFTTNELDQQTIDQIHELYFKKHPQ